MTKNIYPPLLIFFLTCFLSVIWKIGKLFVRQKLDLSGTEFSNYGFLLTPIQTLSFLNKVAVAFLLSSAA